MAVAVDPGGDDDGVDGAAALAALHHQRVEHHVRVGAAIKRAGAELLHHLIEALGELETWDLLIRSTPMLHDFSTRLVDTPAR